MKQCPRCQQIKPLTDFYTNRRGACKECKRAGDRAKGNSPAQRAANKTWKERRRIELRNHIYTHLFYNPCVDCGETDIVVLEFDHVRAEKIANISDMVESCRPLSAIIEEIEK